MRRNTTPVLIFLALLCVGSSVQAQTADELPAQHMEEVTVSGQRTGPRMWRISKGEHVMWLLGTPDALPKGMVWDSSEVAAVIKESQWVLGEARVDGTPGLFSIIPLVFQYRRVIRMPEGQQLSDWLSAESLQRFNVLQQRYAPKENYLPYRPMYVAQELWGEAMKQSGLQRRNEVSEQVKKLARQAGLKVQEVVLKIDKPAKTTKQLLNDVELLTRDKELACFDATMIALQDRVNVVTARANAWAAGDVAMLRTLQTNERQLCWEALSSSPQLTQIATELQNRWYAAAVQALDKYTTVFAMRPINQALGKDGLLKRFADAGYQVQGP